MNNDIYYNVERLKKSQNKVMKNINLFKKYQFKIKSAEYVRLLDIIQEKKSYIVMEFWHCSSWTCSSLSYAKSKGQILIVSITADRFIKGLQTYQNLELQI